MENNGKKGKKKLRIKTKKKSDDYQNQIIKLTDKYNSLSNEEIFDLSNELFLKNRRDIKDNITLEVLKLILDKRNKGESTSGFYPDIYDSNFNEKIYKKKEIYIDRIPKVKGTETISSLTNKLCKFNLSYNQKFLKKYLSEQTPYNGLLLFHGTGVGKTCSSISIAEQFIDKITLLNKKIYILLNPSIKSNFIKNIFNIERLKQNKASEQCTGLRYLKELNIDINSIKPSQYDLVNKKILKLINSRYVFYGYTEFANMIEKIETKELRGVKEEYKTIYLEKKIDKLFSDSVMIIDEVHNIKENSNTSSKNYGKILPPILKRILRISRNMKLVLLSATPMFDNSTEIIGILNLLLINDNRKTLKKKDIFDSNNSLTESGKRILLENSRGYISYLRGEHPIKFPRRLFPDIFNHSAIIKKFPEISIDGGKMSKEETIQHLKLIGCPMKDYQLNKYTIVEHSGDDQEFGPFNINGMMASNIIYPELTENSKISEIISKNGFKNIIKKKKKKYEFTDPKYNTFFTMDNLRKYSSKIHSIIENIEKSEGIIFIYSQFIYAGILPLALALEMNGYVNYNGSMLANKEVKPTDKKFILITGDNELSQNTYEKYLKVESENINGEKVKVIIGSSTAAEGLDFRYIREVHILDPWHHFNKLEQVIGRAIRNCSHIELPLQKRNVLVYMYASIKSKTPEKESETIDLKMYRVSEKKAFKMSEVEYLLKISSVDCNLNKEENRFLDELYTKEYEIETSKNTKHKITLNDKDNSKICNFRECDFKCLPDLPYTLKENEINPNTYNVDNLNDNYNDIIKFIKLFFSKHISISIKSIETEFLKEYNKIYIDLLYLFINKYISTNELLEDKYGRKGYLRKENNMLYFIPSNMKNQIVTMSNIRLPSRKKLKALNVTNFKNSIKTKKKSVKNIDDIYTYLDNLLIDRKTLINGENKYNSNHKLNLINMLKHNSNIAYQYLRPDQKEQIIRDIIKNKPDKLMIIEDNILKVKRDYNPLDNGNDDSIWGYKIIENNALKYYKYSNNNFVLATALERKELLKNLNKNIMKELDSENIIGYLEYKPSDNTIYLKIRDKSNQGKKGTHIKTGSVCGNDGMKKGKIIELIKNTLGNDKYSNYVKKELPTKINLCNELELYLRYNSKINKNNKKWFYTSEETIERELNKKIKFDLI